MCGIAGLFKPDTCLTDSYKNVQSVFLNNLRHRGPDYQDIYRDQHIILAHNRLAIIDLSYEANQPFVEEQLGMVIVFNGEILNFRSLRKELCKIGYTFRSQSDTEVVLKAYHAWGIQCLSRFNGFFAFAIWNTRTGELLLARDRTGIKPLYYYHDGNVFVFASELKALIPVIPTCRIDLASLYHFFQFTYIPQPYTIYENVRALQAGHYLKVDVNGFDEKPYFTLRSLLHIPQLSDYDEAKHAIRHLMTMAVERSLIADVSVGSFLSGGIDSSIVTAIASGFHSQLLTFSIAFPESNYHDESKYAQIVSRHYGTIHHVFEISEKVLIQHILPVLNVFDQPYADSSALAMYVLSKYTRQYLKVVLSGDGADELFGGYNKHRAEWRIRQRLASDRVLRWLSPFLVILPESRDLKLLNEFRKLKKYAQLLGKTPRERYLLTASFTNADTLKKLFTFSVEIAEIRQRIEFITQYIANDATDIRDILLSDIHVVLPSDMLIKVDMMSMAHGLEVRPPFLDNELLEFSFTIPSTFKVSFHQNKKILRDAFADLLPQNIQKRKKHGFEVPLNIWYQNALKDMVQHYMVSIETLSMHRLFREDFLRKVARTITTTMRHPYKELAWSIIVFQHWFHKYQKHLKF